MSNLQTAVLVVLANTPGALTEGEIKGVIGRSWSLAPTLRALRRRDLIKQDGAWWSYSITDAGLEAIGLPPRTRKLILIAGGAA